MPMPIAIIVCLSVRNIVYTKKKKDINQLIQPCATWKLVVLLHTIYMLMCRLMLVNSLLQLFDFFLLLKTRLICCSIFLYVKNDNECFISNERRTKT